jgi:Domain of unknown function (DUF4160)
MTGTKVRTRGRTSTRATAVKLPSAAFDGEIIVGSLPPRAAALIAEWAKLHGAELDANWERARREQSLEAIDPLPYDHEPW